MDARTPAFATSPDGQIPTYYGRPAVKPSLYGWIVAEYIYVGGLAAGVQIAVTVAQLLSIPGADYVSWIGRAIALGGAILGGILLIVDLHTPQRFYNMLRIFRPTSPMSIGTYTLMGFGFFSLVAFIVQCFDLQFVAMVLGCFAGAIGWWMTTYTAALQGATATPLWAATPKLLAERYAASAMATGAAAACLIALGVAPGPRMVVAFGDLAAAALLIEMIASTGSFLIWARIGIAGPLIEPPWGPVYIGGVQVLGVLVPFGLYVAANFFGPAIWFALPASALVLIGGLLMRGAIMLAGNESARRPRDYFRLSQP